MFDEWRIGKDLKGNGSDTIPTFAWTDEGNHKKPQSGQPVSGPRFEQTTSQSNSRELQLHLLLVVMAITQDY
jgi:hypothetical protein